MKIIVTIFLLLTQAIYAFANYKAELRISKEVIKIGEPISLLLDVWLNTNDELVFNEFEFVEQIEYLRPIHSDTIAIGEKLQIRHTALLTSFEAGDYSIPSIVVVIKRAEFKDPLLITTNPVAFKVVAPEVPKDAKSFPIYDEIIVHTHNSWQFVTIAIIGFIVLLLFLFYINKRRKSKANKTNKKNQSRNYIMELENIIKSNPNDIKDNYFRLYSITTDFLAQSLNLARKDIYSNDLIDNIADCNRRKYSRLEDFLAQLEKIVFSNSIPNDASIKEYIEQAIVIINNIKKEQKTI